MNSFRIFALVITTGLALSSAYADGLVSREVQVLPGEKFPQTRTRYLTESEVSDWPEGKIRYAINEMFARHGALFERTDLKKKFSSMPWYHARQELTFDRVEEQFSDVERENVRLLGYFRDAKSETSRPHTVAMSRSLAKTNNPSFSKPQDNSFLPQLAQNFAATIRDPSRGSRESRTTSQDSASVVSQKVSVSEVTPGSERFVIKGLQIGDGSAAVSSFLKANDLHPSAPPHTISLKGKQSIQEISYIDSREYSNGKTGIAEISATLDFTPPFPTSEGMAALVYGIHYKTRYGEGLSEEQVIVELEKRYGKSDGPFGAMKAGWHIKGTNNDCALQAYINPPTNVGTPGELELWAFDQPFYWRARHLAEEHIDKMDSQRPKDTTKPDF